MFIKKDLRKVPKILHDAPSSVEEPPSKKPAAHQDDDDNDNGNDKNNFPPKRVKREDMLKDLNLARRQQEFQGSIQLLCGQPHYTAKLTCLTSLNLYDCAISDLTGIGMLQHTPLQVLNLGRNPISELPHDEIIALSQTLKELWLDDCQLKGTLPSCLLQLDQLELLRLSNNQLTDVSSVFSSSSSNQRRYWTKLRVLSLDRNQLAALPEQWAHLDRLESLLVRHNQLTQLPDCVPGRGMKRLKLLHVSSNQLTRLPDSLVECSTLTHVYVNGNQLVTLPVGMDLLPQLQRLVASHNPIDYMVPEFWNVFGEPDLETCMCTAREGCTVLLHDAPVLRLFRPTTAAPLDEDEQQGSDQDPMQGMVVETTHTAVMAN
jgi:Leucine-rich repeat (LRR) protein